MSIFTRISNHIFKPACSKIRSEIKHFSVEKWRWILIPLFFFLITRLGIFLAAYLGNHLLESDPPLRYVPFGPEPPILGLLSKWDSEWYLYIAFKGYYFTTQTYSPVAFFPLYPLLMRFFYYFLDRNFYLSGMLISNISFLLGLILLYRLVEDLYQDAAVARRAVLYLCIFPASMFFSAIYTEGLYFFLLVGCIYFARKRSWWLSALFGIGVTATRFVGIFILLWVGWEWLKAVGWNWREPLKVPALANIQREAAGLAGLAVMPAGLGAYMIYCWQVFGDPIAFLTAQMGWKNYFVEPLKGMRDYLNLFTSQPGGEKLIVYSFGVILFILFLAAMPWVIRRMGLGAGLFCLACVVIPATTTFSGMYRYIAPLFPFCIILAELGKRSWFDQSLRVVFTMLLAVFTVVFANFRYFF